MYQNRSTPLKRKPYLAKQVSAFLIVLSAVSLLGNNAQAEEIRQGHKIGIEDESDDDVRNTYIFFRLFKPSGSFNSQQISSFGEIGLHKDYDGQIKVGPTYSQINTNELTKLNVFSLEGRKEVTLGNNYIFASIAMGMFYGSQKNGNSYNGTLNNYKLGVSLYRNPLLSFEIGTSRSSLNSSNTQVSGTSNDLFFSVTWVH